MPGQHPGTLKYPQFAEGTSGDFADEGCQRQSPFRQMLSRVALFSRDAESVSQTTLTPAGRGASSCAASRQKEINQGSAIAARSVVMGFSSTGRSGFLSAHRGHRPLAFFDLHPVHPKLLFNASTPPL